MVNQHTVDNSKYSYSVTSLLVHWCCQSAVLTKIVKLWLYFVSLMTPYRTQWIWLTLALACCSDTVQWWGEYSSPRVIISPISCWAGDSHFTAAFSLSFVFLSLFFFVVLHENFRSSLRMLLPPISVSLCVTVLINLNSPHRGLLWFISSSSPKRKGNTNQ